MKKSVLISIIFVSAITIFSPQFANAFSKGDLTSLSDNQQQKKEAINLNVEKVVYTCPMHPEIKQDKPGKCPKCGMNLVKQETQKILYTCPMHPEVVQDKPGKCPKCGMKLVKKEPKKKEIPKNSMKGM